MATTETNPVKQTAEESRDVERTRSGLWYRPNVDILERDDELLLLADVPGAGSNDIQIQFEDGTLSLHAHVPARGDGSAGAVLREYGVGDYYRTFQISEAIDASKISASCVDGVLTLRLPKAEALRPRRIAVNSG
jgi:HSP20 family protein